MTFSKFPAHKKNGRKGDHGRVLVIGGSKHYHGAPILTTLGTLRAGVDLVYLCCPRTTADATRAASLQPIIFEEKKSHLTPRDFKKIRPLFDRIDALVIGNGLGTHRKTLRVVIRLLKIFNGPTVIDADALQPGILPHLHPRCVLTPHAGEFERLFDSPPTPDTVHDAARRHRCTIVCTGATDLIATTEKIIVNHTGCAEMTVGGTGDALAGLIGGFLAQKMSPFDAAHFACHSWGHAGEKLAKKMRTFTTRDLLDFYQFR